MWKLANHFTAEQKHNTPFDFFGSTTLLGPVRRLQQISSFPGSTRALMIPSTTAWWIHDFSSGTSISWTAFKTRSPNHTSGLKQHQALNLQQQLLLLLHPFNGLFSEDTWVSRYQKGKTSLDVNETRDDGVWDGSGISWIICKQSGPRSRQITTPTCHHSIFLKLDTPPDAQPTVSKQWKQIFNFQ